MSVIGRLAPPSLQGYERSWLPRDVVAGVTLAAVAIPETMGYTSIARVPVVTGLYTILFPALAFALLGSSRLLVVGADSATAAILGVAPGGFVSRAVRFSVRLSPPIGGRGPDWRKAGKVGRPPSGPLTV